MTDIEITVADLDNVAHQDAVVKMLNGYSSDPMGDDKPLSNFVRENLIEGLRQHPTTLIFLAMKSDQPAGIAACFRGFSTFAAKPLINLHDFYVDADFRGQGVGRMLMNAVEREAVKSGCCKVTLEVQENNSRARSIYDNFGFAQAVYAADSQGGGTLFMTKSVGA